MDHELPECLSGGCPAKFYELTDEDLRLLEVRFLLVHLSELGLGKVVARKYRLGREELCSLAVIEAEFRAMAQEQEQEQEQREKPSGEES